MRNKVFFNGKPVVGKRVALAGQIALIAVIGALGGCSSQMEVTGSVPSEQYTERHPIMVARAPEVIYVPVSSRGGRLADADRDMIASFVSQYRDDGEGPLIVSAPSGSANEAAAVHAVGDVRQTLRNLGIPDGNVVYRSYQIDDPVLSAPLEISYEHLKAVTGSCGYWPEDIGTHAKNEQYWNFGCATQKNFAAQLAEPRDLITPRGETPRDGGRRTTVFEKYRGGEDTSTKVEDAQSGKISEVGQ